MVVTPTTGCGHVIRRLFYVRIYAAPDGTPAAYAEENVPLTKELREKTMLLPPSSCFFRGVENNDFTMVWGYPGSTDRF